MWPPFVAHFSPAVVPSAPARSSSHRNWLKLYFLLPVPPSGYLLLHFRPQGNFKYSNNDDIQPRSHKFKKFSPGFFCLQPKTWSTSWTNFSGNFPLKTNSETKKGNFFHLIHSHEIQTTLDENKRRRCSPLFGKFYYFFGDLFVSASIRLCPLKGNFSKKGTKTGFLL